MADSKKSPKKGRKAAAAGRKTGTRKGGPDPAKGPPRRGRGRDQGGSKDGRRRRRKRAADTRPRPGRAETKSARAKGVKSMRAAIAAVDASPPPWRPKNQHGGRSNIDPRALAKCVLLMIEEKRPLRGMVAYLHAHPDVLKALGLGRAPSKSTLGRAMRRIPKAYLRRVGGAGRARVPEPRDGAKKTTAP